VGRNDPCPCGSGKKLKKCCLKVAKKAERDLVKAAAKSPGPGAFTAVWGADDDLDEVSNSVLDLVAERRFDEALVACERLQREWPEVVDWLERSALVHEAMGDLEKAQDLYRRALAFTQLPEQRDGFDDEGAPSHYRARLADIETRLAAGSR
jgi:tetratricopeptide (TPR) repeat protein